MRHLWWGRREAKFFSDRKAGEMPAERCKTVSFMEKLAIGMAEPVIIAALSGMKVLPMAEAQDIADNMNAAGASGVTGDIVLAALGGEVGPIIMGLLKKL